MFNLICSVVLNVLFHFMLYLFHQMPKAKKAKKTAPEAPVCLANERMENVIGKLFVSSFTRLHQIIQKDVVEMFEEEYRWAEELLEEVRREFARS